MTSTTGPLFIYSLRDPREPDPVKATRYIGATSNVAARLRKHLRAVRNGDQRPVTRWLRRLRRRPTLAVITTTTRRKAPKAEREAIALLKAMGANLLNATDGGDGLLTRQAIAALSAAMRRRWEDVAYRDAFAAMMRSRWADPRHRERWLRAHRRSRARRVS